MTHSIVIDYTNGVVNFGSGYTKGYAGDIIQFRYTSDISGSRAKMKFADAETGASYSPFTDGVTSFELNSSDANPVTKYLVNQGVIVKYSMKFEGHTIDPIIIIIPTLNKINAKITELIPDDGIVQLLGISVLTDEETEYIDEITGVPMVGFEDLTVGDYIEVTAYDNGACEPLTATSIVNLPPNQLSSVEGAPYNIQRGQFEVAGVTVGINSDTALFFENGNEITVQEFFAQLEDGYVLITGNWNAASGRLVAVNASILE